MTAIDTWIAELQGNKESQLPQDLISRVDTAVAALQFIAGGLSPAGPETRNTFFAGPTSGAAALPTFRALVNADFPAALSPSITGLTLSGNLALASASIIVWNADTGITRTGAAALAFGNGGAADASAALAAGSLILNGGVLAAGAALATVGRINVSTLDAVYQLELGGTTNGIRFGTTAAGGTIEATDNTFAVAFEKLTLGGSTLALQISGADALTIDATKLVTLNTATLLKTGVSLTNNAGAQVATLTNGPTAGNPTKWFPINDNGTVRNIPAW